jgi:hypothetical protein
MAPISADVIKSALLSLEALLHQAALRPDANRAMLARAAVDALKVTLPEDLSGQRQGTWAALPEAEQKEAFDKLESLRNDLTIELSPPGLKGSRMLMSSNPAPSSSILFLLILSMIGIAGVLWVIVTRWEQSMQGTGSPAERQSKFALAKSFAEQASKEVQTSETAVQNARAELDKVSGQPAESEPVKVATAAIANGGKKLEADKTVAVLRWQAAIEAENQLGPPQKAVIIMVVLLGTLGGLIHLASSLTIYVGNRDLKRSWIIYYLLAPLQGAGLAPVLYLLLKSAVLTPQYSGGAGTENLNLTAIYAFAGLTGLFSKQAIEKLADVFATLFAKIQAKDTTKGGADAAQ